MDVETTRSFVDTIIHVAKHHPEKFGTFEADLRAIFEHMAYLTERAQPCSRL